MTEGLQLPDALTDDDSIAKMLLLLFPCAIRKELTSLTLQMSDNQRFIFVQVFKENNVSLRNKLFSDPLVKYLWSKIFIKETPETCIAHLRRIRSNPEQGEIKYERMLQDMLQNEIDFNFKMIPDIARDESNTRAFSQHEKYLDFVENVKYNKKYSKTICKQIAQLSNGLILL